MQKSKLIQDWKEVQLGDVAEFINGRAFKPSEWESKGKIIIRIQDLTGNIENPNFTTKTFENRYLVKKGDLLISWSATLDAFIWNKDEGWLNQHIFKVVENKNLIDKKFLYYLVKIKIEDFKKETHGSTMKHITKGDFNSIKFLLPSLQVQKHIISKLERAETLKQKRDDADKLTREYLQSVFYEMFYNNEGFEKVELSEITECLDGKRIPLNDNERKKIQGNIPYYGANGQVDSINKHCFDEELLLVAEDGGSWGNGEKCSYIIRGKSWVNNHAHVLKMRKGKVNIYYLMYWLNTEDLNRYISGTTRGKLNQKIMNGIAIPLPPLELQQKFALIVEQVEKLKEKQKQSKEEINVMFDSLMKQAFNGELIK